MKREFEATILRAGFTRVRPKETIYPIYSKDTGDFQRSFTPDIKRRENQFVIHGIVGVVDWRFRSSFIPKDEKKE